MVRLLQAALFFGNTLEMINIRDGVGDGRARRSVSPGSEHEKLFGEMDVGSVFVEAYTNIHTFERTEYHFVHTYVLLIHYALSNTSKMMYINKKVLCHSTPHVCD